MPSEYETRKYIAYAGSGASICALAFALFGAPPYLFFTYLKVVVGCSSVACSWCVYKLDRRLFPLSFVLMGLGAVESLAKFTKGVWVPWNWAMILTFCVVIASFRTAKDDLYGYSDDAFNTAGALSPLVAFVMAVMLLILNNPQKPPTAAEVNEDRAFKTYGGTWKSIDGTRSIEIHSDHTVIAHGAAVKNGTWATDGEFAVIYAGELSGIYRSRVSGDDTTDIRTLTPKDSKSIDKTFFYVPEPEPDHDD